MGLKETAWIKWSTIVTQIESWPKDFPGYRSQRYCKTDWEDL